MLLKSKVVNGLSTLTLTMTDCTGRFHSVRECSRSSSRGEKSGTKKQSMVLLIGKELKNQLRPSQLMTKYQHRQLQVLNRH